MHSDNAFIAPLTFFVVGLVVVAVVRWLEPIGQRQSMNTRRVIAVGALIPALLCWANELLGWGFFRGFEERATMASFVVLAIFLYVFRISLDEMHAYRDAKRRSK